MTAGTARGSNPNQRMIYGRENLNYTGPEKASGTNPAADAMGDFSSPEENPFAHLTGKDRIEAMTSELVEGMNSLVEDEESLNEYVDFLRSGYNYSASNQLLLNIQKPGQGNFKTYKQWAALGYQVSAGTTSATVLRPSIIKEKVTDANGAPVMDEKGKPKTRERLVGYTGYPVFSASDLDPSVKAPPMDPVGAHVTRYRNDPTVDDNQAMRADLEAVAAAENIPITYRSASEDPALGPSTGGYAYRDESGARAIVINSDHKEHSQTFTLAHEISHVLCGHLDVTSKRDRQTEEVEAETMAYSISRGYGLDCRNRSFAYLKGWAGGDEKKIRSAFTSVSNGAKRYYGSLEKVITGTNQTEQSAEASAKVRELAASKPRKKTARKTTKRTPTRKAS